MKVQSYYYSELGFSYAIADEIAQKYRAKADQMPPAYQPDREYVVFVNIESGKLDSKTEKFCKSLTPAKTKSVAISICGADTKGLDELKAAIKETGVMLHEEVYTCTVKKGGLFKKAKLTDEQLSGALVWAEKIIQSMQQ